MNNFLGDGISSFFIHKIAEGEAGYNYYGYMHVSGQSIIMRQTIATDEIQYASAGLALSKWANRATLTYTNIMAVEEED